jgi:hypothetical protein
MMAFGALALIVTLADTARLFVKAGERSDLALFTWALWAVALVGPLAMAAKERRRKTAVPPREAAWQYLLLGYGLAIFALRVIEVACRTGL